jgi:hypothetical protein
MSVSSFPYGTCAAAVAVGPAGILVLSAASSSQSSAGATWSGWEFNTTGSLDEIGPGIGDRTGVSGEYYSLEPETDVGNFYEVRCASMTAGTWNTQAASVGTWVDLTAARIWFENVAAMGGSSASAGGSFEVGLVGTSTAVVTATLTALAQRV